MLIRGAICLAVALLCPGCLGPPAVDRGGDDPDVSSAPQDLSIRDLPPDTRTWPDSAWPEASFPGKVTLRVLTANVGNLDEASDGACPTFYKGALCELDLEQIIASKVTQYAPDIVVLNEVWDSDYCQGQTDNNANHVCHDYKSRQPYQQARRLLGSGYTITCDGIAHFDCVGVLAKRFSVKECAAGALCIDGSTTPAHPAACKGMGSITSVSSVHLTLNQTPITVVNGHPLNAYNDKGDPCRLAQYKQIFEVLANGKKNLLMGDMNGDPIRFPSVFPSFVYWNQKVGAAKPFRYHSGPAEGSPPPTTWMNAVTLDYVLSDFAVGVCRTLGKYGGWYRLDYPMYRMDHNGILCDIAF